MPLPLSLFLRALLFALGLAVSFLPRGLELRAGPKLGLLFLALDRRRRRIVEENLLRCLPELGEGARRGILRANFEHYGLLALELLHFFSPFPGHYRRYARRVAVFDGYAHWEKAQAKGKGVIFVSCHLGNWELMAAAGGLLGIPLTFVTRRLKPPWLHEKVEAARASTGVGPIYLPRTLPAVLKALRQGRSVAFAVDQYAHPPIGIPARFFGVTVDTLGGIGPIVERTGAALIPSYSFRDEAGVVHGRLEPELELGPAAGDPARVAQIINDKIEAWVRARPELWLWAHRRFKNLPPETKKDPGGTPGS